MIRLQIPVLCEARYNDQMSLALSRDGGCSGKHSLCTFHSLVGLSIVRPSSAASTSVRYQVMKSFKLRTALAPYPLDNIHIKDKSVSQNSSELREKDHILYDSLRSSKVLARAHLGRRFCD